MTRWTPCCFALLMGLSVVNLSRAQDRAEKPFTEYADPVAGYLPRRN